MDGPMPDDRTSLIKAMRDQIASLRTYALRDPLVTIAGPGGVDVPGYRFLEPYQGIPALDESSLDVTDVTNEIVPLRDAHIIRHIDALAYGQSQWQGGSGSRDMRVLVCLIDHEVRFAAYDQGQPMDLPMALEHLPIDLDDTPIGDLINRAGLGAEFLRGAKYDGDHPYEELIRTFSVPGCDDHAQAESVVRIAAERLARLSAAAHWFINPCTFVFGGETPHRIGTSFCKLVEERWRARIAGKELEFADKVQFLLPAPNDPTDALLFGAAQWQPPRGD